MPSPPRRRVRPPRGRVLVLLAAVPFVLSVLSGNVFSLHVGAMGTSPVSTPTLAAPARPGAAERSGNATSDLAWTDQLAPFGGASSTSPGSAQAPETPSGQHLLHLLGACMAVLLAGFVVSLMVSDARRGRGGRCGLRGPLLQLHATLRSTWWPPPLRPATTSPVARQ